MRGDAVIAASGSAQNERKRLFRISKKLVKTKGSRKIAG
jgi:hypothetical protein